MRLFFILLLLLFFACQVKKTQLTMPEEQLVKILLDMHIAEAALFTVDIKLKDSVANVYYQQIYDRHGVTDSLVQENIFLLKDDYRKMHEIYKKVEALNNKVKKKGS